MRLFAVIQVANILYVTLIYWLCGREWALLESILFYIAAGGLNTIWLYSFVMLAILAWERDL